MHNVDFSIKAYCIMLDILSRVFVNKLMHDHLKPLGIFLTVNVMTCNDFMRKLHDQRGAHSNKYILNFQV